MALPVTQKALELSKTMASKLRLRFGGMATALQTAETFDTNGYPVITISDGTPATDEAVIVIRTIPYDDTVSKDILGLTQNQYANHIVQIVTETSSTGLTSDHLFQAFAEAFDLGCVTQWYQRTHGTAPTVSDITSGNLKSSVSPNVYWAGLISS